jgi:hypothetical protein
LIASDGGDGVILCSGEEVSVARGGNGGGACGGCAAAMAAGTAGRVGCPPGTGGGSRPAGSEPLDGEPARAGCDRGAVGTDGTDGTEAVEGGLDGGVRTPLAEGISPDPREAGARPSSWLTLSGLRYRGRVSTTRTRRRLFLRTSCATPMLR